MTGIDNADSRHFAEARRLVQDGGAGLTVFAGLFPEKQLWIAEALGDRVKYVRLGIELSRVLVETQRDRRSMATMSFLSEKAESGPICFLDAEILFDPGMEIDPYRALVHVSKTASVFCDWPGPFNSGSHQLVFAEPGDPAFRTFPADSRTQVFDDAGQVFP